MKNKLILASTFATLLLSACASNEKISPPTWAHSKLTAETRESHKALAQHYEEVANEMRNDADEEREQLNHYQMKPEKYGKQIQDLKARSERMVRDFELAAQESQELADYHRQLAEDGE